LITTDYGSTSISNLSGDGNGGFMGARSFATGLQPYAVVAGDLNADGIVDLVVTDSGSGDLQIFLGNGKGGFGPLPGLAAGRKLRGVAIGDFNGDGRPDLAAVDSQSGKVILLINSCPASNVKALPEGDWGGTHIRLSVTGNGAAIEYDCGHGTVDQKIELDEEGRFDVQGTHEDETGGPVRDITAIDERGNSQTNAARTRGKPARYTGRVTAEGMTLTVKLTDTSRTIGEFSLRRGVTPRLHKCLQ
jgi:hypothetical protein